MAGQEALSLRWQSIDLYAGNIQVTENCYKLHGQYIIKEPKTASSKRLVTLPTSLKLMLLEYKSNQAELFDKLGKPMESRDFVFSNLNGQPIDPYTVSHAFQDAITNAGLPHIRIHDLRHTHATIMLKAGVHPKVVSERLGHASIAITLDTYSHVLPGLQQDAAEKFDRVLSNVENQKINLITRRAEFHGFTRG
jgi:integrase